MSGSSSSSSYVLPERIHVMPSGGVGGGGPTRISEDSVIMDSSST